MPNYMMLLHQTPVDYTQLSPDQIQAMIRDYMDWRQTIANAGKLVGGDKLRADSGKTLINQNGGLRVTDGPFIEAKEMIGGYFTIAADGYEEAVEMSKSCPHLKYGGRIELREIEPVH